MFLMKVLFLSVLYILNVNAGNNSVQYCENNTNTAVEYKKCIGEIVEEDVDADHAAENACISDIKKSVSDRKACVELEAKRRQDRARERIRQEEDKLRLQNAVLPPHLRETAESVAESKADESKHDCNAESVMSGCERAYRRVNVEKQKSTEAGDKSAQECAAACLSNTYQNKKFIATCSPTKQEEVTKVLARLYPTCGVGTEVIVETNRECEKRDVTCLADKAREYYLQPNEDKKNNAFCVLGNKDACSKTMSAADRNAHQRFLDGHSVTSEVYGTGFSQVERMELSSGISVEKMRAIGSDEEIISYRGADGKPYSSYAEAREASLAVPPSSGGTSGSTSGSDTRRRDAVAAATDEAGGSGSVPAEVPKTETPKTAPLAPAKDTAALNNKGGANSGGAATSGASGSINGGLNSFSNPYANTTLAANSKSPNGQGFSALSDRSSNGSDSESVGGDGDTGSQNNDGSGFNQRNVAGKSASSSEAVNRDAPVGTSSLGSGGAAVVANNNPSTSIERAKLEDLGGPSFQNGFHKASSREPLSPSNVSKTNAKLAKMGKAKRKKMMDRCKSDMSCIASILGVSQSRRGRGLASIPGQGSSKGIWSGHTDILSHMAKVHDKMPINYEGEIDE